MMPPKLVLLKSNMGASGGLEKYTSRLAKAFHDKGIDTTILTSTSRKKPSPSLDVPLIPLCKESKISALNLYRFDKECQKWLEKNPTPLIFGLDRNQFQTHYRAGNGVHAAYLARRCRQEGFFKRLSFSINPLHNLILAYEKKAFEDKRLQVLFTNSHMVKNEILDYYKVKPEKIEVVHNGVQWHEFQKDFETGVYGQNDCLELLFVGHGFKRKGLLSLIEAISLVKDIPIHLSVVGKDRQKTFFEHVAKVLNVNVTFYGPQKEMRPFYQKADALVIPSLYDPFANVTVEALAMGLFVVSSSSNGGSEVLTDKTGRIINNIFNLDEFADHIRQIPRKTKESALVIRNAVAHLDFEHQLNKILTITLRS